jgi:hypothetical protein
MFPNLREKAGEVTAGKQGQLGYFFVVGLGQDYYNLRRVFGHQLRIATALIYLPCTSVRESGHQLGHVL